MLGYVLRRLLFSIPVLLLASIAVFIVVREAANPLAGLQLNPRVSAEDIARYKDALGLDESGVTQYTSWLGNFLRGNWGFSIHTNLAVGPQIREALANTLVLGLTASVISLGLGIAVGLYSALRRYTWFDYAATGGAFLGLSMPIFWLALVLQVFVGVTLTNWLGRAEPILPTAGMFSPGTIGFDLVDRIRHLILPVAVLSVQFVAVYSRYVRSSMLDVLSSDYLRTARAKGLRERRVIMHHGMRNALIPLTTQVAIDVGSIAGGLIVTETIFEWPGMGKLFVESMRSGDFAVVLPWTMIVVGSVILFNLLADLAYGLLDPRVRYG